MSCLCNRVCVSTFPNPYGTLCKPRPCEEHPVVPRGSIGIYFEAHMQKHVLAHLPKPPFSGGGCGLAQHTYGVPLKELHKLLWTWQILSSMDIRIKTPMTIHEDNQTCVALVKDAMAQRRTRYMDIRYHFIRDHVELRHVEVIYCPTKQMIADILTKTTSKSVFKSLRDKIAMDVSQLRSSGRSAATNGPQRYPP